MDKIITWVGTILIIVFYLILLGGLVYGFWITCKIMGWPGFLLGILLFPPVMLGGVGAIGSVIVETMDEMNSLRPEKTEREDAQDKIISIFREQCSFSDRKFRENARER